MTSDRVEEYFLQATGKSVSQFVAGLECFCLSGVEGKYSIIWSFTADGSCAGLARHSHDELNELKAKAAGLILEKLRMYSPFSCSQTY